MPNYESHRHPGAKGGTGKTTRALHWAVLASGSNAGGAAVVDVDPQASASAWWSLRRKVHGDVRPPVLTVPKAERLDSALQACRGRGIDVCLIDTMPRIERPCIEAARASDLIVIPCGPSPLDIQAIGATVGLLEGLGKRAVIVLNQGRPGSPVNRKALVPLSRYGLPVCPTPIMRRAALADAFTDGRAVTEVEPKSKASLQIAETWRWLRARLRDSDRSAASARTGAQTHA